MDFNPENMRNRFRELGERRDAILAASEPKRARRDTLVSEARAEEMALNKEIRDAEDGLFEIDNERAMISRALAGRTGEAESAATAD